MFSPVVLVGAAGIRYLRPEVPKTRGKGFRIFQKLLRPLILLHFAAIAIAGNVRQFRRWISLALNSSRLTETLTGEVQGRRGESRIAQSLLFFLERPR